MKRTATERIWILLIAGGFFAAGVIAVSLERGPLRSALLTVAFAGLLAVALRQTLRRMRENEYGENDNRK